MKQIRTVDQMKDALLNMARLDGQIEKAEAKRASVIAKANAAFDAEAREATQQRAELDAKVREFAGDRQQEFCPDGKKTLELPYGRLSWRNGAPKLVMLEGWTDEQAVEAAKANLKPSEKKVAIEIKTVLKKAALKALKLGAERLAAIGFEEKSETTLSIETYPEKAAA